MNPSVALNGTIVLGFHTLDANNSPKNSDALPTYRVYGPNGYLSVNGTAALAGSGTIAGVTAANPAVVTTSANHNLTTGTRLTIAGVTGTGNITNVNTTAVITVLSATTYSVPVDTTGGTYTSGGTWNITGLYRATIEATAAAGFAAGSVYEIFLNFAVTAVQKTVNPPLTFNVV